MKKYLGKVKQCIKNFTTANFNKYQRRIIWKLTT